MNIKKILVPIDFAEASAGLMTEAAYLARRFQSEILLLHVVTPLSYPPGMLESKHEMTARDLHSEIVKRMQQELDRPWPAFDGLTVRRMLLRGHIGNEIVRAARDEKADLIAMAMHGYGSFWNFLPGSVTAHVLRETECPVWTGVHLDTPPPNGLAIRSILCAVDLTPHGAHTLSLAKQFAQAFDARIEIAHVTAAVEAYGPGGLHVVPEWKKELVDYAATEIARFQQQAGTSLDVVIESGNAPQHLNRIAAEMQADLLIVGHTHGRSHLGDNSNARSLIQASDIPVLSV